MYTRDRGDRLTWVHERIYAGGGDHIPKEWGAFRDRSGISAILHLNPNQPTSFDGPSPTAFLWMNVNREVEVSLIDRWMAGSFLHKCVQEDQRVLIHSTPGRHRVRWVYVAYLIVSGRGVKGSISEVEKKPWLSPYHTKVEDWIEFHHYVTSKGSEKSGER